MGQKSEKHAAIRRKTNCQSNNPQFEDHARPKSAISVQTYKTRLQTLEGRVCSKVVTKPDILCGVKRFFLVKANVSASMKQQIYWVYCHLDQLSGEVAFSKCNCKSGQDGGCKHVAALLYLLLDYKNLELKEVTDDMTCT